MLTLRRLWALRRRSGTPYAHDLLRSYCLGVAANLVELAHSPQCGWFRNVRLELAKQARAVLLARPRRLERDVERCGEPLEVDAEVELTVLFLFDRDYAEEFADDPTFEIQIPDANEMDAQAEVRRDLRARYSVTVDDAGQIIEAELAYAERA